MFCPLAGRKDLALAGRTYPEEAAKYMQLERRYDSPIKPGHWLADIIAKGGANQLPLVFGRRSG